MTSVYRWDPPPSERVGSSLSGGTQQPDPKALFSPRTLACLAVRTALQGRWSPTSESPRAGDCGQGWVMNSPEQMIPKAKTRIRGLSLKSGPFHPPIS